MNILDSAAKIALSAKQKMAAMVAYIALQMARREANKRPIHIGPGKRSVHTLHRWIENAARKAYAGNRNHVSFSSARWDRYDKRMARWAAVYEASVA